MTQTQKSAVAIVTLTVLIACEAYLFAGLLDWYGWFTWKKALVCIATPMLATLTVAGILHRHLPVKIAPITVASGALLLLLWQFPLTATPRFFIAANQIKPGMTVREVEQQMQGFPCGRDVMYFSTIPSEEVEATSNGISPDFTGELVYKSYAGSYSAEVFTVKQGVVTAMHWHFMFD